jgi:hypothetical protein
MTIYPHDHILRFRFESEARPDISQVIDRITAGNP